MTRLLRIDAETCDVIKAITAGGGWICLDYAPGPWPSDILTPYEMMRGSLSDREWQAWVAEARSTLSRSEALVRAVERHATPLDVRATALGGPLGRMP
ncbi:MAG: hypothetical protein R3D27_15330 [Hyphomicrobiaceae bacterium]